MVFKSTKKCEKRDRIMVLTLVTWWNGVHICYFTIFEPTKKCYWIQSEFCFSKIHLKTKKWFIHKPNLDFLKNSKIKPTLTPIVLIMVIFIEGLIYLGPTQGHINRCWYCRRGGLFGTIKSIEGVKSVFFVGVCKQ